MEYFLDFFVLKIIIWFGNRSMGVIEKVCDAKVHLLRCWIWKSMQMYILHCSPCRKNYTEFEWIESEQLKQPEEIMETYSVYIKYWYDVRSFKSECIFYNNAFIQQSNSKLWIPFSKDADLWFSAHKMCYRHTNFDHAYRNSAIRINFIHDFFQWQ